MRIYDTKLRKKVKLQAGRDGTLRLYTCGPTVYNFAHIGNWRTYIFEDLLRRAIQYEGLKVYQVMNITDVDDKTIHGAKSRGVSLEEFTRPFMQAFFEDLATLNIEKAEKYPLATEHIDAMIELISDLLSKDYAYIAKDHNIFFRIESFSKYGALSHLRLDELKKGASMRTSTDEYDKENVSDFVLWKAHDKEKDGQVFWQSPWGKGRPGWHIECSAMAKACLGETIDLHAGGVDNIFPHHENEIAQTEASTGKTFAKHWMHSAHLIVDGAKMSKSLGNFYTLKDLLEKGYSGREVRYLLMSTHYRVPLNFTFEGLEGARNSLKRIDSFIERLEASEDEALQKKTLEELEEEELEKLETKFSAFITDDLNISGALGALFDFIRAVNALIDQKALSKKQAKEILRLLSKLDSVLGVMDKETIAIPIELQELLSQRERARKERQWALADDLRQQIDEAGFVIEDTSLGPRLKVK